jgi:hypothetical protein
MDSLHWRIQNEIDSVLAVSTFLHVHIYFEEFLKVYRITNYLTFHLLFSKSKI